MKAIPIPDFPVGPYEGGKVEGYNMCVTEYIPLFAKKDLEIEKMKQQNKKMHEALKEGVILLARHECSLTASALDVLKQLQQAIATYEGE